MCFSVSAFACACMFVSVRVCVCVHVCVYVWMYGCDPVAVCLTLPSPHTLSRRCQGSAPAHWNARHLLVGMATSVPLGRVRGICSADRAVERVAFGNGFWAGLGHRHKVDWVDGCASFSQSDWEILWPSSVSCHKMERLGFNRHST